jgi:hypothetical protein
MCALFVSADSVANILHRDNYLALYADACADACGSPCKVSVFFRQILTETGKRQQTAVKLPSIKFYETSFSGAVFVGVQ